MRAADGTRLVLTTSASMPLAWSVNVYRHSRARVDGSWANATNDIGAEASEFFIDDKWLASLPTMKSLQLETPQPEEQTVVNRVQMQVIGILRDVPIAVFFDAADQLHAPERMHKVIAERVYVVRDLPVPLHVARKHLEPSCRVSDEFWPEAQAFGPPYSDHPYWTSDAREVAEHEVAEKNDLEAELEARLEGAEIVRDERSALSGAVPAPSDMVLAVAALGLGVSILAWLLTISGFDNREL